MKNEKDPQDNQEVEGAAGEVIIFEKPADANLYTKTVDHIRMMSGITNLEDAEPLPDDEADKVTKSMSTEPKPLNISNLEGLPLPVYISRLRAKRVAQIKNRLPKAA